MKGYRFIVSGDPVTARETVYSVLANQGYTITRNDEWSGFAERGSASASILLGALAGKSGRHVKVNIFCQSTHDGTCITLSQGTSGMSGGVIGMSQAQKVYSDIYNTVGAAFQNAGVLISGSNI